MNGFYQFKYDSLFGKVLGNVFGALQNLLYPQIFCIVFVLIINFLRINSHWPKWTIPILFVFSIICGLVLMIRFFVCKKGVFLYDTFLEINRFSTTATNRKMNIRIAYNEIDKIYVNYQNLRSTPNYRKLLVLCGARDSYVEIITKTGKQLFFSVENQEEFCDKVRFYQGKLNDSE